MVCVFCSERILLLTDLKIGEVISSAFTPETRITAMAPAPAGLAKATIVSCTFIFTKLRKRVTFSRKHIHI